MDILHLYRSNESEAERLINSVQMFTKDIKLDFEIIKCALSNKTKKIGKSDRSEININLLSKLKSRKFFKTLNSRTVSPIRYLSVIFKWTKEELRAMDQKP